MVVVVIAVVNGAVVAVVVIDQRSYRRGQSNSRALLDWDGVDDGLMTGG